MKQPVLVLQVKDHLARLTSHLTVTLVATLTRPPRFIKCFWRPKSVGAFKESLKNGCVIILKFRRTMLPGALITHKLVQLVASLRHHAIGTSMVGMLSLKIVPLEGQSSSLASFLFIEATAFDKENAKYFLTCKFGFAFCDANYLYIGWKAAL